uniref:Uncharacterized protein n=1 Tax=Zea mays TaxID=4577 RepID=C0PH90_MAIZE|nr:unknown [Zea mays]
MAGAGPCPAAVDQHVDGRLRRRDVVPEVVRGVALLVLLLVVVVLVLTLACRGGGGGGRLVELGVLVFAAALPQRGLGQSGR